MSPRPTGEVIRLWERGRGQHPVDRALTLLEVADPPISRNELSVLPIGDRDRCLLDLRRRFFGDELVCEAECRECGQRVEIAARVSQLLGADPEDLTRSMTTVEIGGLEVELRPADSRDLAAAAVAGSVEQARRTLLDRCVIRVAGRDAETSPSQLSDEIVAEIADVLSEIDPQANTELELECPRCRGAWQQSFDIGEFLWREVERSARRLLRDVHTLAWAYGWSEDEILGLSDARRGFYLEQVERWRTT